MTSYCTKYMTSSQIDKTTNGDWKLIQTVDEYLSHEVGEEEHVAEEGRPSQQVTDAQVAVMVGHVDDGFQQRPQRHPLLGLHTCSSVTKSSALAAQSTANNMNKLKIRFRGTR